MGNLNKIITNVINSFLIKEGVYYHGTPYADSAKSIQNTGLGGSQTQHYNGGDSNGGIFASAQGRQYLTKNGGNAMRYATMMQGEEPYGHVFEFNTDDNTQLGVDEDEFGSIIYKFLNKQINSLPFRHQLLNLLSQDELNSIRQGEFSGYAACKKIIDKLSQQEIQQVLQQTNNATTSQVLKPSKHWIVPRPNEEQKKQLYKAKDFTPYEEYFNKYKQEYFE